MPKKDTACPEDTIALGYMRVSTEEMKKDGLSLNAQDRKIATLIRDNGWIPGPVFRDVLSGERDDRPDYGSLLAEMRARRARHERVVIVVSALDRFGRDVEERERARKEFERADVPLHSCKEGLVPAFMNGILAVMSQEEIRQIRVRVRTVRDNVQELGWYPGGSLPWGLRWRPATAEERAQGAPKGVIDIDEPMRDDVRHFFQIAAESGSVTRAAMWARALPDAARGGRVFSTKTARGILRNRTYIAEGNARWPALIDRDVFDRVQAQLGGKPRSGPRTGYAGYVKYLLTGFLRCPCPDCGAVVYSYRHSQQGGRPYYRCVPTIRSGADGSPTRVGCGQWAGAGAQLDARMVAELAPLLEVAATCDPQQAVRAWTEATAPMDDEAAVRLRTAKRLRQEIERAKKGLDTAIDLHANGEITDEEWAHYRETHRATQQAARAELARLDELEVPAPLPDLAGAMARLAGYHGLLVEAPVSAQRQVLRELVAAVLPTRVGRGRYNLTITWTEVGKALRILADELGVTRPAPEQPGDTTDWRARSLEHLRAVTKRDQALTRAQAGPRRPWTADEDAYLEAHAGEPARDVALALRRSLKAIEARRTARSRARRGQAALEARAGRYGPARRS